MVERQGRWCGLWWKEREFWNLTDEPHLATFLLYNMKDI